MRIFQQSLLVHLALDAVFEFATTSGACWALLAVLSRVSDIVLDYALATSADAISVTGTDFSAVRRFASVDRGAALASIAAPSFQAFARTALAVTVIGSGAENRVVAIAREVVAFAKRAVDNFFGVFAEVALALAAKIRNYDNLPGNANSFNSPDAVSSAAALNVSFVVASALEGVQTALRAEVFVRALAVASEEVLVTFADTA